MFARGWSMDHPTRQGWFRVGQLEVTTTAIMVGLGIASMFVYAVDRAFLLRGAFIGAAVREGDVWQLLTWPLVNPPTRIWVILTLAFFWFVGHRIEDQIGRARFLGLELVTTLASAAIVTAIPFTRDTGGAFGLSILGFGLLVVIAVDNPQTPWFFGIPIWVLVAVYAAVDILQLVGDRLWGVLVLEAIVVVLSTAGAAACGAIDAFPAIPRIGGPRPGAGRRFGRGRGRARRGGSGTVTQGPWTTPSGFAPPTSGPSRLEQAELDVLLDKIGQSGIGSLSKQERDRLDELSRKMRES